MALVLFAVAATLAMGAFSGAFGVLLGRRPLADRLERVVPVLGVGSLVFGVASVVAAVGG